MDAYIWAVAPERDPSDCSTPYERAHLIETMLGVETLPPLTQGDSIKIDTKRYRVLFVEWEINRHRDGQTEQLPVSVDYYVAEQVRHVER